MVLPVLQFSYLMLRSVENVSFKRCFYLAMTLIAFIYLLNCNHSLVDRCVHLINNKNCFVFHGRILDFRNKSEVIINRSEEPERFQNILDECGNRSIDRKPSTKYVYYNGVVIFGNYF